MKPKLAKDFDLCHWCKTWLAAIKTFQKKCLKVDSNHCLTHVFPPHNLFDDIDRAVWRTFVHSPFGYDSDGWITLPGPASWWDDEYKFMQYSWDIKESPVLVEAQKAALHILHGGKKLKGFENMRWSTKELMILTTETLQHFQ